MESAYIYGNERYGCRLHPSLERPRSCGEAADDLLLRPTCVL